MKRKTKSTSSYIVIGTEHCAHLSCLLNSREDVENYLYDELMDENEVDYINVYKVRGKVEKIGITAYQTSEVSITLDE